MNAAPAVGSSVNWIAGQGALAALAFVLLAFAPPRYGQLLLIPLDGAPIADDVLRRSMLGARAVGPLPGSLIADGESTGLFLPLLGEGVILLAAPVALCADHPDSGTIS